MVLNFAASCVMVGVIWFVQLVHYPLLATIGVDRAPAIAVEHQRRTAWVVGLPMATEGVTTLVLLLSRPDGVDVWLAWLGAVLLAVALASTVFLSVPLHEQMAQDPRESTGRRLVVTNWPRTFAWTARAVVAGVMLAQAIRRG
jgi:formate hydrogenlyase subunit 3/multisubunit Na+/H+ antiporter MnhD subunit